MSSPISVPTPGLQAVTPNAASSNATQADATQAEVLNQRQDADLVLGCQCQAKPDKAAFAELMRRYQSHVDRLLYRLAPDWPDRADLAQEVWIRVYRNLRRLKEPAKFKSWVGRITTNLFYDELRKRKRHEISVSLDAPRRLENNGQVEWDIASEGPSPVDSMMSREFHDCLKSAIANLPQAFRNTIILREIKGLAYEEIAEQMGVSLGTVKSRIARARNRLQSDLKGYMDGQFPL